MAASLVEVNYSVLDVATFSIGAIGIVVAPLVAFLAAKRTSAGRIATSEAADLWNESQKIREFLSDQLISLRQELAAATEEAKAEISRLEHSIYLKDHELLEATSEISRLSIEIVRLGAEIVAKNHIIKKYNEQNLG